MRKVMWKAHGEPASLWQAVVVPSGYISSSDTEMFHRGTFLSGREFCQTLAIEMGEVAWNNSIKKYDP